MLRLTVVKRLVRLLALGPLLVGCGGAADSGLAAHRASPPAAPVASSAGPVLRTGPVGDNGSAASCVEAYNAKTIRNRAFAFDGTIVAIGPGGTNKPDKGHLDTAAVTFRVTEWFKGGAGATVTVDLMSPTSIGTRLLVSGEPRWGGGQPLEDAIAWSCGGFTRYYENEAADERRQATA